MDIVYGADVPSVTKKVHKHLAIYPPPSIDDDDKADRYYFEFDEMVPDEREEFETRKAITDVSTSMGGSKSGLNFITSCE